MKPINLDIGEWDGGCLLIHGAYGHGKTRFLGDVLRAEIPRGKVIFGNIKGEDGYSSIKSLGLGSIGYQIDTFDEFKEWIAFCEREKPRAVGLDSLKMAYQLAIKAKVGGEDRLPKTGDFGSNEWPDIHHWMHNQITRLRRVAPYVIVVCPSDLSKDVMKEAESGVAGKPMIMPDLPGKMAAGCVGWFDMCGFLSADVVPGRGTVRHLHFEPSRRFITRQRLPNAITAPVEIPEGNGGWENVLKAVRQTYLAKEAA